MQTIKLAIKNACAENVTANSVFSLPKNIFYKHLFNQKNCAINYSACRKSMQSIKTPLAVFGFFSVFKVGVLLMGDTAGTALSAQTRISFWTPFLAEYVYTIDILTCLLKHINGRKIIRIKILTHNILTMVIKAYVRVCYCINKREIRNIEVFIWYSTFFL